MDSILAQVAEESPFWLRLALELKRNDQIDTCLLWNQSKVTLFAKILD